MTKGFAMTSRLACSLVAIASLMLLAAPDAETVEPKRAEAVGLQIGRDTTVVTEPLDKDGFPDFVAALNQRMSAGVSRDDNFWVLMWPALGNAERSREEYLQKVEQSLGVSIDREPRFLDPVRMAGTDYSEPAGEQIGKDWEQAMSRPWTREEFPQLARWVDAHADVLEEVHKACLRPKAYAPIVADADEYPPLVGVLLPHVQSLRAVARILVSRAMLRLGEGDIEGAWQDLLDMQRLARHSEQGFTLIEALVGYAIRMIGQQPMAHWLAHSGLSAEELEARWTVLEPLLKPTHLTRAIDSERLMYVDTVIAVMAGRVNSRAMVALIEPNTVLASPDDALAQAIGQLGSARDMAMKLMMLGGDINETLRYGNRMYDDLVAAMQPESHLERAARLKVLDQRIEKDSQITRDTGALVKAYLFSSRKDLQTMPGRVLTGLLMPAISAVENAYTRTDALARVMEVCFRVQQQVARLNEVPVSLEELEFAAAAQPIDPFSGEPVRITADSRGLLIYSVGRNGQDDGGKTYGDGKDTDDVRVILPVAP